MFSKIVIANRGEVALRIIRACKKLGIQTVIAHSEADTNSLPTKLADEAICIGPANAQESYLRSYNYIAVAEITNADAIHPGYGFLAEDDNFAYQVINSGLKFIGPSADVIKKMGNKIEALKFAKENNIPCLPCSDEIQDVDQACDIANKIGYPVIIKAAYGGGGKGMHIARNNLDLRKAINIAKSESLLSTSHSSIYLEKYLNNARHIEIQILGDGKDTYLHFFDRDCSIQRKHQKIIEEAPATNIPPEIKENIYKRCLNAAKTLKYQGLGTFEFLYQDNNFYFIEMNTRMQVEHTITEMITGIDLICEQIKVAQDLQIKLKQQDIKINGYSLECRINAEDSFNFQPSSGTIELFHPPGGSNIRLDSYIYTGYTVPYNYDSLLGKLISFGQSRKCAIKNMLIALDEIIIKGIKNNLELHHKILNNSDFKKHPVNNQYLENWLKLSNKQND